MPAGKIREDLSRMDHALNKATGLQPRLFRPPYGVATPALQKAVKAGRYIAVGWNIRSWDTVAGDPDQLLERIMRSLKPGSILLMHDTKRITADLISTLIHRLQADGYEIVRLDKLLNLEPYA
jgi:peptidoglycan/xylan/chitin deacetylase (PgdA/CDA1 family)